MFHISHHVFSHFVFNLFDSLLKSGIISDLRFSQIVRFIFNVVIIVLVILTTVICAIIFATALVVIFPRYYFLPAFFTFVFFFRQRFFRLFSFFFFCPICFHCRCFRSSFPFRFLNLILYWTCFFRTF